MGIASGVLGAGVGLYQTISGAKQSRDAARALENYKRQELVNTAENMQVSTLGADAKREEQARLASTQIDALQGGGTRALLGGLGRVEAGNQEVNRDIATNLDEQQKEIDRLKAQEDVRIQNMTENRENSDIAGLSSQYNAGQQGFMSGMGNIIAGTGQALVGSSAGTTGTEATSTGNTPVQYASTLTLQPAKKLGQTIFNK